MTGDINVADSNKSVPSNLQSTSAPSSCKNDANSNSNSNPNPDPYQIERSDVAQEGDYVLLHFSDDRQIFAQILTSWRGKSPPLKINKRNYNTSNLVGLPYGTVLELDSGGKGLIPLKEGEDLIPDPSLMLDETNDGNNDSSAEIPNETNDIATSTDNRHLHDSNTSQSITQDQLHQMRSDPTINGRTIVAAIVKNSSTFSSKTTFSQAKYVRRKQIKYQIRCRLIRTTPSSICRAYYAKDARRMRNLREDTLAQILNYANVGAGRRVVVMDDCQGVVVGSVAYRMGGYGWICGVYAGNAPAYLDTIARFNLGFVEYASIRWVHAGELFREGFEPDGVTMAPVEEEEKGDEEGDEEERDYDLEDRRSLKWPCWLQPHTQTFVGEMKEERKRWEFLDKRCARFARKLTRPTNLENRDLLLGNHNNSVDGDDGSNDDGIGGEECTTDKPKPKPKPPHRPQCDALILACGYDPTPTLLTLLPHLQTSCPFVVYCEFLEPLVHCFQKLQNLKLAINLRLSDTWMREYQVLPGRTHPNMNMSMNGGFLLTGVKLCPVFGRNELDDDLVKEIRAEMGGRRGKRGGHNKKQIVPGGGSGDGTKKKRRKKNREDWNGSEKVDEMEKEEVEVVVTGEETRKRKLSVDGADGSKKKEMKEEIDGETDTGNEIGTKL